MKDDETILDCCREKQEMGLYRFSRKCAARFWGRKEDLTVGKTWFSLWRNPGQWVWFRVQGFQDAGSAGLSCFSLRVRSPGCLPRSDLDGIEFMG